MGRIISNVAAISTVRFEPFPDHAFKAEGRMVRVRGAVFFMKRKDLIYTDHRINSFTNNTSESNYSPVEALRRLGLITKAEQHKHEEPQRKFAFVGNVLRAAESAEERLQKIGIRLTPQQKKKLWRLRASITLDQVPSWLIQEFKATEKKV